VSIKLGIIIGFLLLQSPLSFADEDRKYIAGGYGLAVGLETLAYFRGKDTFHKSNGGVVEISSPNLSTPSHNANLSLYARLGTFLPVKEESDPFVVASSGLYWHGMAWLSNRQI
jgi:hypothetical protein